MGAATFFTEIGDSLGKHQVLRRQQSWYSMGVLQNLAALIFFMILALRPGGFVFTWASLPTFLVRLVLEVVQTLLTLRAITQADRTTFSFIRVGTIPLLLGADSLLGNALSHGQLAGVAIIMFALMVIFIGHTMNRAGLGYVIGCTVNGAATISLFKYDISHYNSVAAEQLVAAGTIFIVLTALAFIKARENPFKLLSKPGCLAQTITYGLGSLLDSFSYQFAAASVISAAKRSFAVLWSTAAGNRYFQETRLAFKICLSLFLILGILALTI